MHQATSLKFAGSSRDGRGFAAAISPYGWFGHGERARQGQISSFDGGRSWPQAVLTLLIAGTLLGLGTCLRGAMPPRTPPKRSPALLPGAFCCTAHLPPCGRDAAKAAQCSFRRASHCTRCEEQPGTLGDTQPATSAPSPGCLRSGGCRLALAAAISG